MILLNSQLQHHLRLEHDEDEDVVEEEEDNESNSNKTDSNDDDDKNSAHTSKQDYDRNTADMKERDNEKTFDIGMESLDDQSIDENDNDDDYDGDDVHRNKTTPKKAKKIYKRLHTKTKDEKRMLSNRLFVFLTLVIILCSYWNQKNMPIISTGIGIIIGITFCRLYHSFTKEDLNGAVEKGYNENHQMYRNRIQTALGLIGAPPPSCLSQHMRIMDNNYENEINDILKHNQRNIDDIHSKIAILAEQHSKLLKTIDRSIQMIRIATSIQLGLGPRSFSVDRVDANTTYKQNSPVNLKVIREMIFTVLDRQATSILQIRNHVLQIISQEEKNGKVDERQRWNDANVGKEEDNDLTLMNQSIKSSKLFTITLIKSMRVRIGELLSETLSLCFKATSTHIFSKSLSSSSYLDLSQLITQSSCQAEELDVYITASLPEGNHSNDELSSSDSEEDQLKWKLISQLQCYVDGVAAITWAYQKSIIQQQQQKKQIRIINQKDKEDSIDNEAMTQLKKLGDEIHNVSDLYQSIHQLHYNDMNEVMKSKSHEDDNASDVNCESKYNRTKDEKEEYNDKGITEGSSLSIQNQGAEDDTATLLNNKTLVYAGKGVKPNQNHLKKKKRLSLSSVTTTNSPLPTSFLGQSTGRTILLRELQSRLESLEKAEEWDVIRNQDLHDTDADEDVMNAMPTTTSETMMMNKEVGCRKNIRNKDDGANSSAFFLGASGSLLSELKVALSNPKIKDEIDHGFGVS